MAGHSPNVAVCIPVYKASPNAAESLSLGQCARILGSYPIILFGPKSLNYDAYLRDVPARIAAFDDQYFESIRGYSRLMLSRSFYERLSGYEHILIYQLDAFVFRDDLTTWCGRGYDYIGAPWREDGRWTGVGNGGFCLRRPSACLRVLTSSHKEDPTAYWDFVRQWTMNPVVRALKYHRLIAKRLGFGVKVDDFLGKFIRSGHPEDHFWGRHATRYDPQFRVAPFEEAIRFAVEWGLQEAFEVYHQTPPFGCHSNNYMDALLQYARGEPEPPGDFARLVWELARMANVPRRSRAEMGSPGPMGNY